MRVTEACLREGGSHGAGQIDRAELERVHGDCARRVVGCVRQSGSLKSVFEKYNLLGTHAVDCSKPVSENNWYFVHRVIDDGHVQRDIVVGPATRKFAFVFDKASPIGPNEITVSGTRDGHFVDIVLGRPERRGAVRPFVRRLHHLGRGA